MTLDDGKAWFAAHTDGAPDALRVRSQRFFDATGDGKLVPQLAAASQAALEAATANSTVRAAALDLLAADALITLALLRSAAEDPAGLGAAARALRHQATVLA